MPTSAAAAAALPGELRAVDEATRAALEAAGHAHEWDAATRATVLAWVARHRDVLAALEGRVLSAEREAGAWSLRGDRDLAGFVGRQSHQGRGAGLAAVGQAGTLAALPVVAEALVDGPVTTTHVAQITRATAASPALAAELASPEGQAQVVELAGRLDGGEFGKALAQLSACLDPAGRQRSHDEQRAARSLAWTHTSGGTLLKGRLDLVAGHKLAKVIEALCPRPAADDERSREQRQADALVSVIERAAVDRTTTPGAIAPVQAVVTLTQETRAALRAAQGGDSVTGAASTASVASVGSAADLVGRLRGVPPVVDETDQPWPASEVGRALCDCALTRAVVGVLGELLDLGRGERLFQRQHWLALYGAGVRTCALPGCGMPLRYTELHHIRWWDRDGGRTGLDNCAPYCSYHHHQIHRLDIRVTRLADGTLEHRHPDGRRYGPPPGGAPSPDAIPEALARGSNPGAAVMTAVTGGGGDGPPPGAGHVGDAHPTAIGGGVDPGGDDQGDPPQGLLDLLSA